jgi:hypothetical protein
VSIELDKEKALACMSTSIKKYIREIGRKIRKMDMALLFSVLARYK